MFAQATFIGFGPDFKVNQTSHSFRNVELYNLMCQLMDITPARNNGETQAICICLFVFVFFDSMGGCSREKEKKEKIKSPLFTHNSLL